MIRSLGIVVRPNVAPNIRPAAPPVTIETEDETDVEIIGRRGQCLNLDHSRRFSATFQQTRAEEFEIYDVMRVSKELDPEQFYDVEWVHYIQYLDEFGHLHVDKYHKPQPGSDPSTRTVRTIIKQNQKRSISAAAAAGN